MKVQGKGEPVHTWWVQQFCDIFGKKGDSWHRFWEIILRDLAVIELFQISHNCATECTLQANSFVKTYLKAIRDTFFLKMWNFSICDISIQQKKKV